MSAFPHRAVPGFTIMPVGSDTFVGPWPLPWWAGPSGAIRIIIILVLIVLLAHGYPIGGPAV